MLRCRWSTLSACNSTLPCRSSYVNTLTAVSLQTAKCVPRARPYIHLNPAQPQCIVKLKFNHPSAVMVDSTEQSRMSVQQKCFPFSVNTDFTGMLIIFLQRNIRFVNATDTTWSAPYRHTWFRDLERIVIKRTLPHFSWTGGRSLHQTAHLHYSRLGNTKDLYTYPHSISAKVITMYIYGE